MALLSFGVDGGLNLSVAPSRIKDNELAAAYNVVYAPSSGEMQTRQGITAVGTALPDPINLLFAFTRKTGESWLVCISGKKLYKISIPQAILVSSDGFTLTDSLGNILVINGDDWEQVTTVEIDNPAMIAFNGRLLIGDGSASGILAWDGTTVARIAGSPQATALFEINNRVVANSTADGELDAVYFSAAEDETAWTSEGGSIGIRAGYGDGMAVNGFASISSLLVVSKSADIEGYTTAKKLFGIETGGSPDQWYAKDVSKSNAAIGPHCIVGMQQSVFYIDSEGFEGLQPTLAYGDVASDPVVGAKVNSRLSRLLSGYDSARMCISPNQSSLFIFFPDQQAVFVYSMLARQFTELDFNTKINHAVDWGDSTFFAGENGHLYVLNGGGHDFLDGATQTDFTSVVRFKLVEAPNRATLTKSWLRVSFLAEGTLYLEGYDGNGTNKKILDIFPLETPSVGNQELYSATTDLADANGDLAGETEKRFISYSRMYFRGLMFQIRAGNGGRVGISGIDANIKGVGR